MLTLQIDDLSIDAGGIASALERCCAATVARRAGAVLELAATRSGMQICAHFRRANRSSGDSVPDADVSLISGRTVLLVEDDPNVRSMVRCFLKALGCHVVEASTADEAFLAYAEAPRIDVLLSDIIVPGALGTEIARKIRSMEPGVRVIFMSGSYLDDELQRSIEREHPAAFLAKPFSSAELARALSSEPHRSNATAAPR